MRHLARVATILAGLAVLSPFASAYYYWVYFAGHNSPFAQIPLKFDLTQGDQYGLQNKTVPFLISSGGPGTMMPGDSFANLINQIRAAANAWNGVNTSGVRLAFGGVSPMTTPDTTPEVDVVFSSEIPPGLLAFTVVTTVDNPAAYLANGATSLPIVNSQIQLWNDLTVNSQASWSDAFFLTIVHEFGHSLGLQHTLTSSAMSTQITAATTAAAPLAADDIAGISQLYPANGYPAGTGSINGTVTLNGNGVNLANVVALSTNGTAISTPSNPDGTYQINGIPPGQYYIYVHPLPPPEQGEAYPDNVYPPQDLAGGSFPANTSFGSQFYGGTTDWTQTPQVTVTAGNTNEINFNVGARPRPAVSSMTTYAYLGANGQVPVGEPDVPANWYGWLVFTANGIVVNGNQIAPGLNISVIGGAAQVNPATLAFDAAVPQANGTTADFLQIALYPSTQIQAPTPTALAVTLNGDLYVLPAAFTVVPSPAPVISSVTGSTDGQGNVTATIAGSNLNQNTRIMFDDAPATVTGVTSNGSLVVTAPPASSGYKAAVEALSTDNQTSSQALGNALPAQFTYGAPAYPTVSVDPPNITAGTDQMVRITGYNNTNFVQGQSQIGFGTSEITVKSIWVVSPGLVKANISASASARAQATSLTVATGLQLTTLTSAFQINAANPGQASIVTPILNQATQLPGVPVNGVALINTTGLPQSLTGWTLTISNQPATFTFANSQIIAAMPAGLLLGPSVVQLTSPNGVNLPTVLVEIDPPPPAVVTAVDGGAVVLNSSSAANPGDTVTLTVENLADANGNYPAASQVTVTIAGIAQTVTSVTPASGQGAATIQFTVTSGLPTGVQQMTVMVGTRESGTYSINIG